MGRLHIHFADMQSVHGLYVVFLEREFLACQGRELLQARYEALEVVAFLVGFEGFGVFPGLDDGEMVVVGQRGIDVVGDASGVMQGVFYKFCGSLDQGLAVVAQFYEHIYINAYHII